VTVTLIVEVEGFPYSYIVLVVLQVLPWP
jgi:hypothetical protein